MRGNLRLAARCAVWLLPHEHLPNPKELTDQLRRRSFGIQAQQGFGPGGAEQDPCVRSIAIGGGIEKELHAIHVLFLQHAIRPQLLRTVGARALNRAFLHLLRNVQIAAAIIVSAEFTLQICY
jgi:hypothetical protein